MTRVGHVIGATGSTEEAERGYRRHVAQPDPDVSAAQSKPAPWYEVPDAGDREANDRDASDASDPIADGLDSDDPGEQDTDWSEGEDFETVDDQGRRHIHRSAPAGTEELLESEEARNTGLPNRLENWRRRSATGAVLTAFAFGLKEAFDPERKEPAIVMQTSGIPPEDLPVEAQLEQLGPSRSVVTVRPWLLAKGNGALGAPVGSAAAPLDADSTREPKATS